MIFFYSWSFKYIYTQIYIYIYFLFYKILNIKNNQTLQSFKGLDNSWILTFLTIPKTLSLALFQKIIHYWPFQMFVLETIPEVSHFTSRSILDFSPSGPLQNFNILDHYKIFTSLPVILFSLWIIQKFILMSIQEFYNFWTI